LALESLQELHLLDYKNAYHQPSLLSDTVQEWCIPTRGLVSGFFKGKKDQSKEGKQHQNMLGKRKVK
jgi:hypothetical protein